MLAEKIVNHFSKVPINVVVAPAIGGIVIGQEVGRQMGIRTIFSERENGTMCLRRGFTINKDERVLVCEDVVTTGGSVFELIDIVKQRGALVAGVGFIVDRSGGMVNFVTDQFSVFKLHAESYNPEDCPLCADKIPLKKPGSRNIY